MRDQSKSKDYSRKTAVRLGKILPNRDDPTRGDYKVTGGKGQGKGK